MSSLKIIDLLWWAGLHNYSVLYDKEPWSFGLSVALYPSAVQVADLKANECNIHHTYFVLCLFYAFTD